VIDCAPPLDGHFKLWAAKVANEAAANRRGPGVDLNRVLVWIVWMSIV
jgi:hypothetical protein